jgi:hypothetical protein
MVINEDAIEKIISKLDGFVWTENSVSEVNNLRNEFRHFYNKEKIDNLSKEDYFAGLGKKKGCLAYDLEWGTRGLGSIKGGSKYKYGYETDFKKIKSLLQKILAINFNGVYDADGSISSEMKNLVTLSKEINGFKTGRTVLPKMLSIYYPDVFFPIFNDQDHFLQELLTSMDGNGNAGLELYLDFNFNLMKIKHKLEELSDRTFDNFEFALLLYHVFPKETFSNIDKIVEMPEIENPHFEALEVQHYQSLLHRNFRRLFPTFKYFDEEEQIPKNGQYDTQAVGIMDMLCVDEKENFVIIEIKRQARDKTLGQILRYMGWTKEELCKDGQKVKGIIVAERKDIQLEFALKVIPDVKFMKLGLSITLDEE